MSRPALRAPFATGGSRMRRAVLVATLVVAALGIALAVINPVRGSGPNYGTLDAKTTVSNQAPEPVAVGGDDGAGRIVPKPNSGRAPRDQGERGGLLQSLTFFLICGALAAMAGLVWWESSRKRARAALADPAPDPAPDPLVDATDRR